MTVPPRIPPALARRIWDAAPSAQTVMRTAARAANVTTQALALRDAWANRPRNLAEVRAQTRQNFRNAATTARQGSADVFSRGPMAARGARIASAGITAGNLPQTARQAFGDVRQALRTGSRADIDRAIGSSGRLLGDTAGTALHVTQLARDANRYGQAYRAARQAYVARAPEAPAAARSAARRVAADTMRLRVNDAGRISPGAGRPTAVQMQQRAGEAAARRAPAQLAQSTAQSAANAASRAGRQAAVRVATGQVARLAGRLTPGVNGAMFVADAAAAYQAWRDPNASTGRRVTATITALGSAAAASNIPVVSQVGAVVSTLSSWVGSWFS